MKSRLRILLAMYLLAGSALSWLWHDLDRRFRTDTGLVQAFYRGTTAASSSLFRRTSRGIDLDFLEDDPSLPRRFFRVQWEGVWYLPDERRIDIHAGGDDLVIIRIDGNVVVERSTARGLHTISERVTLDAGFHRIEVQYEQYGGGFGLNVRWAPAGEPARSFESAFVFPAPPSDTQLTTNRRLTAFRNVAAGVWIVPALLFGLWVGWPHVTRSGRRAFRSWRDRSQREWRQLRQADPTQPILPSSSGSTTWRALYAVVIVAFLTAVGQFYQPGAGFTYLIYFGDAFTERTVSAVREVPHYIHGGGGVYGYDGQFYAQLAVEPLLGDYDLRVALDSAPYRSRRMLFSWTAFALGLGRPAWVLQAYALQNVLCWLILAWVLLRWLPPTNVESFARWFACLFSHGLIVSVRHSLLEGPSMLLITLGVLALEHGRTYTAAGILGVSGVGRETNLLAASILAQASRRSRFPALRWVVIGLLVVVPLVLWFFYILAEYGPRVVDSGGNLTTPLAAYLTKWEDTLRELRMAGWWSWPARHALFGLVSLTAQAGFLVWRAGWSSPWWRLGMTYVVLMVILGGNVWAGYPGAATRVLLPMTFAFNLLLPRGRWFWPLFAVGNLSVLSGLATLAGPA